MRESKSFKFNLKINFMNIPMIIMIIWMNFYALLSKLTGFDNVKTLLTGILIISFLCIIFYTKSFRFSKLEIKIFLIWIVFFGWQIINIHNTSENWRFMIREILFLLIWIVISRYSYWIDNCLKWLVGVGFINVIATYFFILFPNLYSKIINLYGSIPTGTSGGKFGFRAGIADHYSQNAIFISIVVMVLFFIVLNNFEKIKLISNIKYKILLFLAIIALLLTGKRGVLIYITAAIFFSYLISTKNHYGEKYMKLALIIIVGLIIVTILADVIPEISYVFERFKIVADDSSTNERLLMWNKSFEMFKNSPIIGNGTYSFRYQFSDIAKVLHSSDIRYYYLNAHNVYFQLLAENGIIGLGCFLFAAFYSLYKSFRLIKKLRNNKYLKIASVSFSIQVFTLIYCAVGNCLYDIVFSFYCCAICMMLSLYKKLIFKS